jgi:hypothetical protein
MYQIDVSTAATSQPASTELGTPGYFTDGNAATGLDATVVPAEFLNTLMVELMNVVTGSGLALSKSSFNQVYTAIQTIAQGGASNYGADTGVANAYAVTYSPQVEAPSDGMVRAFKVKTSNTGASTFTLDGSSAAYPIYGLNGSALQGGELTAPGIAVVQFNGALSVSGAWVLYHCGMSPTQVAAATKANHAVQLGQVQSGSLNYAAASGTADALTATLASGVTALADGFPLTVKAASANATTTPTLNLTLGSTATGAKTIVKGAGGALVAGDIAGANHTLQLTYSASLGDWVLDNPATGAAALAVPQPSSASPAMDGTASVGTATTFARGDHVHPSDTTRAPLASPAFTGTPTVPTAAVGTSTIQAASTAFAMSAAAAAVSALTNNTSASSDISLNVGQAAYIDISGATSVPLHIATGDNQAYEIDLLVTPSSGSATPTLLLPNNSSYTNYFVYGGAYGSAQNSSSGGQSAYTNGFALVPQAAAASKSFVSTKTAAKGVNTLGSSQNGSSYIISWNSFSAWLAAASTQSTFDTTTAWTSLGTITFPSATSGRIIIRRIA